jgi:hypothetical protein
LCTYAAVGQTTWQSDRRRPGVVIWHRELAVWVCGDGARDIREQQLGLVGADVVVGRADCSGARQDVDVGRRKRRLEATDASLARLQGLLSVRKFISVTVITIDNLLLPT